MVGLGSNMMSWRPLISRLLRPCSTKYMPSVVMKDGMRKRVVTRPLTTPTPAPTASATASASHSFMSWVTKRIAQTIGTKAKFWPTERSNSPDIISRVIPTETMPTVAAMLEIAVMVCGDQKLAVCSVKKSATAIRPAAGVSSRMRRNLAVRVSAWAMGAPT